MEGHSGCHALRVARTECVSTSREHARADWRMRKVKAESQRAWSLLIPTQVATKRLTEDKAWQPTGTCSRCLNKHTLTRPSLTPMR
eukprot:1506501-Rhodomonas_salina.1